MEGVDGAAASGLGHHGVAVIPVWGGDAVDGLELAPAREVVAEAGSEARSGEGAKLPPHIPGVGVIAEGGQLAVGVVSRGDAAGGRQPIGGVIGVGGGLAADGLR